MDNAWPAIGAVFSGVFGILIGYLAGRSGSPKTPAVSTVSSTLTTCQDACSQLENARQQNCMAQSALSAANSRVSSLNAQLAIAWAVAAALWAGLLVLGPLIYATIYWFGAYAAGAVASAATAFALYLTGLLIAAQADQSDKQMAATAALQAVIDARNAVLNVCKGQELTDCLNRPSPCG